MTRIGLIGGGFQHAYSSTLWKRPNHFEWSKGHVEDITCYVDEAIVANMRSKGKKFAWVVESSSMIGDVVDSVIVNYKEISKAYDFLISHDRRIVDLAPNFHYLPPHGYWIENPELYAKTKVCSMITSNKRMCAGHNFRLDWMEKLKTKVDIFGRGINNFDKKEDVLADYMFSVTIENDKYSTYWSEKILDCFACGTIPIYHGAPDIGDYFNMDGIILLNDNFDINTLTTELYLSKEDAIIDNFQRSLQYDVIEDMMWNTYINKI